LKSLLLKLILKSRYLLNLIETVAKPTDLVL